MKAIAVTVSLLALMATIVPSVLYFKGNLDHEPAKLASLIGTIAWFVVTPLWMGRELDVDAKEVEI